LTRSIFLLQKYLLLENQQNLLWRKYFHSYIAARASVCQRQVPSSTDSCRARDPPRVGPPVARYFTLEDARAALAAKLFARSSASQQRV
jgi:hypothetical protein